MNINEELTKRWTVISKQINSLTNAMDNFDSVTQPAKELDKLRSKFDKVLQEYEDLIIDVNVELLFAKVEDQLVKEGYLNYENETEVKKT